MAVNYSNLKRLDEQIGKIINQLKEDGLYDNSIIFFYGDHGGPFPRHKRALYDTGIKVPLVIKFQGNLKNSNYDDRLVSFIDFAPTMLSWAGIAPPRVMQGKAQFGVHRDSAESDYIFASSDRFDEMYDKLRAVRSKNYKYIMNFNVEIPNALSVEYREQMPMMQNMMALKASGKLDSIPYLWFRRPKPDEELYDLQNDPFELVNLSDQIACQDTLVHLRRALDSWIEETNDQGRIPEKELIARWLPNGKQPKLKPLQMEEEDNRINLISEKYDATIIWKQPADKSWHIYSEPLDNKASFIAKAVRIGYEDSDELLYNID
jgi:arylsulfatase A-like enzyme